MLGVEKKYNNKGNIKSDTIYEFELTSSLRVCIIYIIDNPEYRGGEI